MDYSLPGSSVRGIHRTRILDWVAISFPGGSVKNLPAMQESGVPLAKGMATHSSILVWRISWTEEPDQSMGSQRVRKNWVTNTHTHIHDWVWHFEASFHSIEWRQISNWEQEPSAQSIVFLSLTREPSEEISGVLPPSSIKFKVFGYYIIIGLKVQSCELVNIQEGVYVKSFAF